MLNFPPCRGEGPPGMMGPLFNPQFKTFSTYNFFFPPLVGLGPGLKEVRCFGMDGEKALENALQVQFKSAIHLRCFLHLRGNLKAKLSDLGVSKPDAQEFVKDVLGNPALLKDGLVDAEPSKLNEQFANLKTTWDDREASLGSLKACFHDWFEKNSLKEVRNCMLKEKRELAGLGSPPEPFYTNDLESKNRVLKHQTDYKPQELPAFVEAMKTLFQEQKQEVQKAIVRLAEYKLSPKYSNLERIPSITHNLANMGYQ